MKKLVFFFGLCGMAMNGFSQVGINTATPNAQLEIKSGNQAAPTNTDGVLIPKIDAFPATNPTAAQNSMMVYLTATSDGKPPGFYYWDDATSGWKSYNAIAYRSYQNPKPEDKGTRNRQYRNPGTTRKARK
jgi:hypothetical protein